MIRVNGLYGHARRNDFISIVLFLAFLLLFELLALAMFLPHFSGLGMRRMAMEAFGGPKIGFFELLRGGLEEMLPLWSGPLRAALIWFSLAFFFHIWLMKERTGFSPVTRNENRRLYDIVERISIAAGIPLPRIGIVDSPNANAFACGLTPRSSWIVVTRGLLNTLNDDELEAVVAHESIHIKNRDIRLMAAASIFSGIVLRMAKALAWRHFKPGLRTGFALVFMPFVFWEVAFVMVWAVLAGALGAGLTRLAISRAREFVADAEAVQITHNPDALISALLKIEARSDPEALDPSVRAMAIGGATEGWLATHPAIAQRIAALQKFAGAKRVTRPALPQSRPHLRPPPRSGFGLRGIAQTVALPVTTPSRWMDTAILAAAVGVTLVTRIVEFELIGYSAQEERAAEQALFLSQPMTCFPLDGSDPYKPGTAPFTPPERLDAQTVASYSVMPERPEYWVAKLHRRRSEVLRELETCRQGCTDRDRRQLTRTFGEYVDYRQSFAREFDRRHGEAGLAWVASLYDTESDALIRREALKRVDEGTTSASFGPMTLAIHKFFAENAPQDFRPCRQEDVPTNIQTSLRGTLPDISSKLPR